MLRDILDQIVRRRLWPIPALAIAVVVAAPLLLLKSAPQDAAPAAGVAPAPAQADLPARAQRLLVTSDAEASGRRLSRAARDPFEAPSSHRGAAAGAGATKSSSKKNARSKSPSTRRAIQSSTPPAQSPAPTSGGDGRSSTARSSESSSKSWIVPTVDVRFGAHKDSPIQRRIARLKTFELGGKVVVVFVKYSHARHKAVFAIAPTTGVHGDNRCRRKDGVCHYVDIPVGSYARLTFVADDGSRVSRRLDVVRVHDDA
jgi:hypothetical protein